MADPYPYSRGFSFTGQQTATPQDPLPAPHVDTELDTIGGVVNTLVSAVKDIRRADGALKNGIVTIDSVASGFMAELKALAEAVAGSEAAGIHADAIAAAAARLAAEAAAALAATATTFIAAGTGARSRNVQDKLRDIVSVLDYEGVDPSGFADSGPAFQKAVDALPSGGLLRVPHGGNFKISTPVLMRKGIKFVGDNRADLDPGTNGSGNGRSRCFWGAGTYADAMFTWRPATTGDAIWGAGWDGIELDGSGAAHYGLRLDNSKYAQVGYVPGRSFRRAMIESNSDTGSVANFSMQNVFGNIEYIYGADPLGPTAASSGLVVRGSVDGIIPTTQHQIGKISGLLGTGYGLEVYHCDNMQVWALHAPLLLSAAGSGPWKAFCNFFAYVVGRIVVEAGANGNRFLHVVSEATSLTGTGNWWGDVYDNATDLLYRGHSYALRKWISVPAGAMVANSTTNIALGLQFRGPTLTEGTDDDVCFAIPEDFDLPDGQIERFQIIVGTNGTSAGSIRLRLILSTVGLDGAGLAVPEYNVVNTYLAPGQYGIIKCEWLAGLAFTRGQHIFARVVRESLGAGDTHTDPLIVVGARVGFKATGPTAGSGPWNVPQYLPAI